MRFESFTAWRFLWKATDQGKISPMTIFAWIAVAIGVAAMASLLSVMQGFEGSLINKVLTVYPHVLVRPSKQSNWILDPTPWTRKIEEIKETENVIPFLETEMVIQSSHRTLGAVVWGIPQEKFKKFLSGELQGKLPEATSAIPQILLGRELAHRLTVKRTQEIKLISPLAKTGLMAMTPQSNFFQVSGIYASGHYEFDQQHLCMLLEDAQDLIKKEGAISGWQIWGKTLSQADLIQKKISAIVPSDWKVESWTSFNSALFYSLKLEQLAMFLILSFAIAIAVMNVVITLVMHVTHKKKNIGVLRAMGATKKQITRIFFWQGIQLGGIGLFFGSILYVLFIIYVRYFSSYELPEIYYDRKIPVEIRPATLSLIFFVTIFMIFLATWYPAKKAASLDPIESLRE